MLRLALSAILAGKARFVGAFIALLGASAMVTACGILFQSGLGAGVPTERFAAASVVVGANQNVQVGSGERRIEEPLPGQAPLPADMVNRVAAVPGVLNAVGEVSFPASVVANGQALTGPNGQPSLGHGWDSAVLAPFTLSSGSAPTAADQVVLDPDLASRAGVHIGQRIDVELAAGTSSYLVTGITANSLARQSALFFAPATARTLSGDPAHVDAIGVIAKPGTGNSDLAASIQQATGAVAYTGDDRSQPEFADIAQARQELQLLSGSLGGIAVLIAMFVVASTLALSVQQRRREFALLRAVAATPKQVMRLVSSEALLVSVTAGVVGCAPGVLLAYGLRAAFVRIGALPGDFQFSIGPLPLLAAVVLCVLTAELAAWTAARRAARTRPVEALGEAAVERAGIGRGRWITGLVFLALGVFGSAMTIEVTGLFAAAIATAGGLFMIIGTTVLGPPMVKFAARMVGGPLRTLGTGGYLAAANTLANSRRLAAAVAPLLLGVSFTALIVFFNTTQAAGAQSQARAGLTADYVLAGTSQGLPPAVAPAARSTAGVAAATPVVRSQVLVSYTMFGDPELEATPAQGVTAEDITVTTDLGVKSGDLRQLRGDTVAVSQQAASMFGTSIGSSVQIYLPDGTRISPKVVAIYQRGLGFGDVTLPHDVLLAHVQSKMDETVLVRTAPGADPSTVAAALRKLGQRFPGTLLLDQGGFGAAQQVQQRTQEYVNFIPLAMILAYIALSVANTLVMTTAERVREFALLRMVGMTRRQVIRMMWVESLVVVGIAVVIGSLLPIPPLVLASIGLTGSPLPSVPPLVYLGIVAAALLLGLVSTAVPTRFALRAAVTPGQP